MVDTSKTVNEIHDATKSIGNRISDWVSSFVGSWYCLGLHACWFALWFAGRLDVNLLTLIVSLEAIFLCTILLMNANRQADKDRIAAEHDFQTNREAKEEIERLIVMTAEMHLLLHSKPE